MAKITKKELKNLINECVQTSLHKNNLNEWHNRIRFGNFLKDVGVVLDYFDELIKKHQSVFDEDEIKAIKVVMNILSNKEFDYQMGMCH